MVLSPTTATVRFGMRSVRRLPVVPARRERVVADDLQVSVDPFEPGRQDDGGQHRAYIWAHAGKGAVSGVEHRNSFGNGWCPGFDAVNEGPRLVLALEQEHAGVLDEKFKCAVEEVGRMDRARLDPLHLFENARAVI